ncbi:FUSC family protein [Microbacterium sp. zg.Y1090]|uniref:FUSC family protein n=1 Tax=Microbacterium TaxID=33882 RepID=UPI00214AEF90|nr:MULTISPECIES: FUSC family protein [unclassified Microbacterium]MCR2812521.1 FUSC family protein [Microbacterium sp. zg.Y1084]MCR2817678.1 FUSC family protein [Microbacterium sp. zg.Y1090]MDL5485679.1 FUSC family protein [Microbacterium sp. zg-Y1211]WIM28848.1 FUSC family protein [Microbacterium sp. zg-Y1090]
MEVVWIVLGIVVLAATLLDVFLSVLNYDEAGLFVHRVVRWEWVLIRAGTRRIRRRWRPVVLRQVTGLLIVSSILWWVTGIILGFSFIYYGAMLAGDLQISTGVPQDYWGALYLSVGQFSTVGVDNISPGGPILDLLTVSEAMADVLLLSFIIAFLSNIYGVVQSLRALSSNFFHAGHGVVAPVDTLAPFFPDGQARGLDSQLGAIADSLAAYSDGLSQNPVAYYFQSGRDQFSLPFSLYMTSGVIGALRWGLPTGSDPAKEPGLARLTEQFYDLRAALLRMLGRVAPQNPEPVSAEDFAAAMAVLQRGGRAAKLDPWVVRFFTVQQRIGALVAPGAGAAPTDAGPAAAAPGAAAQRSADPGTADAYRRYVQWLPFEVQSQWLLALISRDLDYQPVYRGTAATPDGIPLDDATPAELFAASDVGARVPILGAPVEGDPGRRPSRLTRWLRRRHLFIDPGWARLIDALRTLAAVALALAVVIPLSQVLGPGDQSGAVFAAMVALFTTPAAAAQAAPAARTVRALVSIIPVSLAVVLGALLSADQPVIVVSMALAAGLAVWLRRFGPRVGAMGQLFFLIFYFSLLVHLSSQDILFSLLAAIVGLAASWLVQAIPGAPPARQVHAGIAAVYERIEDLLDTLVDLVSSGRPDRRLVRELRSARTALEHTVDDINGPLERMSGDQMNPMRVRVLRMRIFDVQLAAENLLTLLPVVPSIAITVDERARLAGDLVATSAEISAFRGSAAPPERSRKDLELPPGLTSDVRRVLFSIMQLRYAVERLRRLQLADDKALESLPEAAADTDPGPGAAQKSGAAAHPAPPPQRTGALRPTDRQAAQATAATGIALLLGSLVSSTHQYWAAMPAFQTISGSDGETRVKSIQRIVATVAASGIAFGLAIVAGHDPLWAYPLLIVSVFFVAFTRSISPAAMVFWITLGLATMYDVMGTLSVETVQARMLETFVGGVVAIVISALLLPTRTGSQVAAGMTSTVGRARALMSDLLAARRGEQALTPQQVAERERELAGQLRSLEMRAAPLRRDPGSLRTDGIEAQLTALWSVLDYERRLGRSLVRLPRADSPADTAQWSRLAQMSDDNFAALQEVLRGALPSRLHPLADLALNPGTGEGPAADALIQLTRLNQSVLALIESIRPGTVDPPDGTTAQVPADIGRRRRASR